jgi:hypothetical protein
MLAIALAVVTLEFGGGPLHLSLRDENHLSVTTAGFNFAVHVSTDKAPVAVGVHLFADIVGPAEQLGDTFAKLESGNVEGLAPEATFRSGNWSASLSAGIALLNMNFDGYVANLHSLCFAATAGAGREWRVGKSARIGVRAQVQFEDGLTSNTAGAPAPAAWIATLGFTLAL